MLSCLHLRSLVCEPRPVLLIRWCQMGCCFCVFGNTNIISFQDCIQSRGLKDTSLHTMVNSQREDRKAMKKVDFELHILSSFNFSSCNFLYVFISRLVKDVEFWPGLQHFRWGRIIWRPRSPVADTSHPWVCSSATPQLVALCWRTFHRWHSLAQWHSQHRRSLGAWSQPLLLGSALLQDPQTPRSHNPSKHSNDGAISGHGKHTWTMQKHTREGSHQPCQPELCLVKDASFAVALPFWGNLKIFVWRLFKAECYLYKFLSGAVGFGGFVDLFWMTWFVVLVIIFHLSLLVI